MFVAALAPDERCALLDALAQRLRRLLPGDGIVASYCAIGDEIDPVGVHGALGERLALPYFAHSGTPMAFRLATGPLDDGPFHIPQPGPSAPHVRPAALIVPLIAADARRHRLGQGKGHYDRALAGLRGAPAIGVAWDIQVIDHVPDDPWDIALDYVVTPTRVIDG